MKRVESYEALRRRQKIFWRILGFAIVLFLVAELGTSYLVKSYALVSSSMTPALQNRNFVLVAPAAYGIKWPFASAVQKSFRDPARGDVLLLGNPSAPALTLPERIINRTVRFFSFQQRGIQKDSDPLNRPVIKRVVALPGDTVKIENHIVYIKQPDSLHFLTEHEVSGKVYDTLRSGMPASWGAELPFSGFMSEITLQDNQFFVINDNRLNTNDSRFFGVVSKEMIRGKVFFKYWPFSKPFFL